MGIVYRTHFWWFLGWFIIFIIITSIVLNLIYTILIITIVIVIVFVVVILRFYSIIIITITNYLLYHIEYKHNQTWCSQFDWSLWLMSEFKSFSWDIHPTVPALPARLNSCNCFPTFLQIPWRIQSYAIYGLPFTINKNPSHVSIYITYDWILWGWSIWISDLVNGHNLFPRIQNSLIENLVECRRSMLMLESAPKNVLHRMQLTWLQKWFSWVETCCN